jgi:single-stranded-DNA-specific exonuclease
MEPFGPENLRPVFITKKVMNTGYSKIVKEEHIKFSLRQGHTTFTGIGFGLAGKFNLLLQKKPLDLVFKIDENEWNGEKTLQLRVLDLRISEP